VKGEWVNFGLIGLGYWGQNYVRLIGQTDAVELTAMCDTSPELVDFARPAAPAARGTSRPDELLAADDVDAVVIATPARTHFELVSTALANGKHVLCEKPLAMTAAECERLIELAEAAERTLFVGHTFVYNDAVRAARDFIARDELGATLYAQATWAAPGPVRHDVNALWDLAPHPVSILMHVLRCQPVSVAATGQAILDGEREDVVSLHLRFEDGAAADVHLSWLAPQKVRSLMITGARRIAIFDDMVKVDKLRLFDTSQLNLNGVHPSAPPKRTIALAEEPVEVPEIPVGEPLAAQFAHFLECCRLGLTPESDGRAGTNVVKVLEAAEMSLESGGQPTEVSVEAGRSV
jgi:predicted dehydrogenase